MNKTLILQDIDITYLIKAEKNLTDALHHLETNQLKMGAIQAFKLCHELCWKILKKVITKVSTIQPQYFRDVYREAAQKQALLKILNYGLILSHYVIKQFILI